MSKFTEGKWKETEGFIYSEEADRNLFAIIADVVGQNGEGLDPEGEFFAGNYTPEGEEKNANIRLIISAPDLLKACKYVIQWHREHDSGEGELFGLDFVTTCINAVRKAEGK